MLIGKDLVKYIVVCHLMEYNTADKELCMSVCVQ